MNKSTKDAIVELIKVILITASIVAFLSLLNYIGEAYRETHPIETETNDCVEVEVE